MFNESISATDILAIPDGQPERLFTGDIDLAKIEFRKLAQRWHPDRNPDADPSVFAHLNVLHKQAENKLALGTWCVPGLLTFTNIRGIKHSLRYRKMKPFELGEQYIGDRLVTYVVRKEYADLVANALKRIKELQYASDKMKEEISKYLPQVHETDETVDRLIIILKKDADMLCLQDVLEHLGGKIEPKHIAWIISSIYNVLCYLRYAGLVHGDISPVSYFISPKSHNGMLLGGWWYTRKSGERFAALPTRTAELISDRALRKLRAQSRIDTECLRLTGRELLGPIDKTMPKVLTLWLKSIGSDNALEEYRTWANTILIQSFGARKFAKLELTPDQLYQE